MSAPLFDTPANERSGRRNARPPRRRVRARVSPRNLLTIAILVGAFLAAIAGYRATVTPEPDVIPVTERRDEAAEETTGLPLSINAEEDSLDEVVIYLSGHIHESGVYRIDAGSRVADAIDAAGGFDEEADRTVHNLARVLTDGEHIHVPAPGESMPVGAEKGGATGSGAPTPGKININAASSEDLQQLSGIGPALAQRIIEHREANGPFQSVDQLDDVSGIGPAMMERLRDAVTLQ